jgi:hypothetical protein
MFFNQNGFFVYQTVPELTYNLLNAMGMAVLPNGTVIDTDAGGAIVQVSGRSIKATINDYDIKYPGATEVALEPLTNSKLLTSLLGRVLDKFKEEHDGAIEAIAYFPEETVPDIKDSNPKKVRMGVKWSNNTVTYSNFFYNRCLAIIELIFIIAEMNVDLNNFDIIETDQ